jgi:hypothetical protein
MSRTTVIVPLLLCLVGMAPAPAGETARLRGSVGFDGTMHLKQGNRDLCSLHIGLFEKGWQMAGATGSYKDAVAGSPKHTFRIKTPSGKTIAGDATVTETGGKVEAVYQFTPAADVELHTLHVSADFPTAALSGVKWTAGDKSGEFPAQFKDTHVFNGKISALTLALPQGELAFTFPEPTSVLLQDNRQWNTQMFSVRLGLQPGDAQKFAKGQTVKFGFSLSTPGGIAVSHDSVTTIVAGPDWTPLKLDLDIEPNSALDFSGFGFQDAPAGKHGRVICRPDGQFAFEKTPDKPQRFYGVNFCFSAHYITHEQADVLAERLMRLGYNTIRIHHYEGELVSKQKDSTTPNPEKLDQLDYLVAACAKRGLYSTTDLFVSRPVPYKELGIDKPGNVEMDMFKIMVPVVPGAWANFTAFAKNLLTHESPHRKLKLGEDPALAWLSVVNEGMYGNFMDRVRQVPEWTKKWNEWLAKQYPARERLAEAWGKELKENEDPAKNSVALPANIYAGGPRVRDCHIFFAAVERETVAKVKAFLRDECGCKALVTNANAWTNFATDQAARQVYDYVDDHFYIDHPHFIEQPWRLPSRCDNKSPIAGGASGGRHCSFTRLCDKPFTITEYNYSGPGRFRGVGGILTGAMGALQGWGGIWRFAYSHSRDDLFRPARMDYFNMVSDPLGQAAERASLCLYLRQDMKSAPHSVAVAMTEKEVAAARDTPKLVPAWHWMAWVTRVGTQIVSDGKALASHTAVLPFGDESRALAGDKAVADTKAYGESNAAKYLALLKDRKIIGDANVTDPAKNVYQSETGEITIDAPRDIMTLDTPRTAGGYATAGQSIVTADKGVSIAIQEADATAWVSPSRPASGCW